ncbi:MAG: SPOR domain-containing protein [Prevotella sp.]|jgi:flagellar biosynthesis GTPase FlhF
MRKIVIALLAILCSASSQAQTFTDHLLQKNGKGTVTIDQSKEIEKLVNGNNTVTNTTQQKKTEEKKPTLPESVSTTKKTTLQHQPESTRVIQNNENDSIRKVMEERHAAEERRLAEERRELEEHKAQEQRQANKERTETESVNMRKKVMRGSHKVTGYRIQVYSGGNSRADRQRAQQIGNKIKMKFPDQPVYVHFYSPSWKCRVGNFRTYEEANRMLRKIKAMGYRSATILKGKITVQY